MNDGLNKVSTAHHNSTQMAKIISNKYLSKSSDTYPKQKAASMVDVSKNSELKLLKCDANGNHGIVRSQQKTSARLILKEISKPHHNVGEKVAQIFYTEKRENIIVVMSACSEACNGMCLSHRYVNQ
ncbi:unnamed protein product [Oppiella nova]|uniref:Uncharacterized protein n=1 Tax=Oppiella nova TaxID=334625 RepID=A0A7R9M033_9ACAR|nr:unnamed protein product [Oppiella nova]CAG2168555.1 unnamed protein product [Oppiella nova]